ncbi:hypothetical protein WA026_007226 [Henosepilachna vigintioctopunctata]|uniref:Uncharacterized protein n=1 Tax=Henosepilachna vigintioctopunctata TaxID=420089 RepID=A0AAW1V8F6_9CUCU
MAVDGINITFKSCDCSSSSSSDEDAVPKQIQEIQTIPHAVPPASPQRVPQAAPLISPQRVPHAVPPASPQRVPHVAPLTSPQRVPHASPLTAPQTVPHAVPQVTPQNITRSRRRLWDAPRTPVFAPHSLSYQRASPIQSQPRPIRVTPQIPQEDSRSRRRWDPPSMPKLPKQKRKPISFHSPKSLTAIQLYKSRRSSTISQPRMSEDTAVSPIGEPQLLERYAEPMTPPFNTPLFNQPLQEIPVQLPMVCSPRDNAAFGQDLRYNVPMPQNLFGNRIADFPEPSPPGHPEFPEPTTPGYPSSSFARATGKDLSFPQNEYPVSGEDLGYYDSFCPPYCEGLPSNPQSDFSTFANLSGIELSTLQSQFLVSDGSLGAHTPTFPYLSGNDLSTPRSEFLASGGDLAGENSFCPQLCGDELSTLPSEFLVSGGSLGTHSPTFPYLSGDELSTPKSEFLVSGGDLAGDTSFCPELCGDELSTLPSEFLVSGGSLGTHTPTFPHLSGNELSTPGSEFLVSGGDLAGNSSFYPQLCGDELSTLPSEYLVSGESLGAHTPPTFPYLSGNELSTPKSEFLVSGGDLAYDTPFCPQVCGDELSTPHSEFLVSGGSLGAQSPTFPHLSGNELSTPRSEFLASGVKSQRQSQFGNLYENEMPPTRSGLPNQNLGYDTPSCPRLCGSEMSTPGSSMLVSGGSLRGTSMSPNIPLEPRPVQKQKCPTGSNITSDASTDDKSSSFRPRQRKRLSPHESESRGSSSSSKKSDNQIAKIAGRSFLPTSIKEARNHITDAIKNMFSKDEPTELDAIIDSVRMYQSFRRNVAIASTPASSPVNTPTRPPENPSCTRESNCA